MLPDTFVPPIPYACDGEITRVVGMMDATESLTFDTTMTPERPRDLGPCGNTSTTASWARQEIIEYLVPGTGPVAVRFDTRFSETTPGFNTLVQVRTDCHRIPVGTFPPTCFDDSGGEPRASGAVTVTGGDTLYFVVTGYSDPPPAAGQFEEGVVRIDLRPSVNTAPTIDDGGVVFVGRPLVGGRANDAALVDVVARDAEGTLTGYTISLTTVRGRVDLNGDGEISDDDVIVLNFDALLGTGPYLGRGEVTPFDDGWQIAAFCRTAGCTEIGIRVIDQGYAVSGEFRASVGEGTEVGRDLACDRTNVCLTGLACIAGICGVP